MLQRQHQVKHGVSILIHQHHVFLVFFETHLVCTNNSFLAKSFTGAVTINSCELCAASFAPGALCSSSVFAWLTQLCCEPQVSLLLDSFDGIPLIQPKVMVELPSGSTCFPRET